MADLRGDLRPAQRYRFGIFEADAATGELRRQGMRVKLNAQPFQVLLMLLDRSVDRPGQLLTRDEISKTLWPDGTFVDFEHGVNSAVLRVREALGDTAGSPRFVETLARRGYRFLAPVEPGNLFLLSYKGDIPIVSAPSCFRSAKPNVVDLVLPSMLARYRLSGWEVACLGHGGLLI